MSTDKDLCQALNQLSLDVTQSFQGADIRFAQMVLKIYIDGAILAAQKLGVSRFVVVAPGKVLNKSIQKTIDGWHYRELADGSIYISSMALQNLVIARGIENMVPWVQSHLNPRLKVSLSNNCIVADINQMLLMCAGNVHPNPGPVFVLLAIVGVSVLLLHRLFDAGLDFSSLQSIAEDYSDVVFGFAFQLTNYLSNCVSLSVRFVFGHYLDNYAYDCAIQRYYNEQWRSVYNIRLIGGHLQWLSGKLPNTFPSYAAVQHDSIWCQSIDKLWGIPIYVSTGFGIYDYIYYGAICCAFISLSSSLTFCVLILRYITGGVKKVSVVNKQKPFNVNELKDLFSDFITSYNPKHIPGKHNILANQRRMCEQWCFNVLLDKFKRVRDVGGSRGRFAELGYAKHVCGPILSNDDILRSEKDRGLFENCGKLGELCPNRLTIPAAIFSHVDYHMTLRQLTQCVTGPSFVINHDFNKHDVGVGKYYAGDKFEYEAYVKVFGSKVSMTPDNGTPYLNHPFHNWGTEGSVVSQDGAFVYVKLGDYGETSVYYCHPSDGVYSVSDPNSLTTKFYGALPNILGSNVEFDDVLRVYRFSNRDNATVFDLDKGLVDEVAIAMASCIRDAKYPDTLRSYLSGKMRAKNVDMSLLEYAYGLCSYLSDVHAVKTVPFASCIMGHPVHFRWYDIVYYKVVIYLTYFSRILGDNLRNRIMSNSMLRKCAPWLFMTVRVPSYETYVNQLEAKFGTGLRGKFNKTQFRSEATPIVSGAVGCGQQGARKDDGQCVDKLGNEGVKHSPEASAPPHEDDEQGPHSCVNADSSGYVSSSKSCESSMGQSEEGDHGNRGDSETNQGSTDDISQESNESPSYLPPNPIVSLRRVEGGFKPEPICRPSSIAYCDYSGGVAQSFTIYSKFGTTHNYKSPKHVKDATRGNEFFAQQISDALSALFTKLEECIPVRIDYAKVLVWAVEFFVFPSGRASDKSAIPKGYGLLPLQSIETLPDGYEAFGVGDVGIALPYASSSSTGQSSGKRFASRNFEKRRPRKMFPKD